MTAVATPPRTWLYVPGDRPDRFDKAAASGTDVVILDLEDAVSPDHKDQARANVVTWLSAPERASSPVRTQVRINPIDGERGRADIAAIRDLTAISEIRVPKVSTVADADRLAEALGSSGPPAVALLESAAGIENAAAIAAHPVIAGLGLGEADLSAELSLRGEDGLTWIRTRVVVAAAAAGLPPVAMSAYTNVTDLDGLATSCARGRDLGMFGRAAIHPRQLAIIGAAFLPDAEEIARAREILDAARGAEHDGVGALALPDGRFIDAPVVERARRVLALADETG